MKRKLTGIILLAVIAAVIPLSISVEAKPPVYAKNIMETVTITGVTRENETLIIQFLRFGAWNGGVPTAYYLVYRKHMQACNTLDLQGHLEIANFETGYKIEFYHSWRSGNITTTLDHEIHYDGDFLEILWIPKD